MKAIIQDKYGSAEVLELRDVEKPRPGDDELLDPRSCGGRRPRSVAPDDGPTLSGPRHGLWLA